jgi:hypothetical protein
MREFFGGEVLPFGHQKKKNKKGTTTCPKDFFGEKKVAIFRPKALYMSPVYTKTFYFSL